MWQSVLLYTLTSLELSSDLLAKSEIFNGEDVVGDAACVTPLEGSGGMLPEKILKNRIS